VRVGEGVAAKADDAAIWPGIDGGNVGGSTQELDRHHI
jgi:hypothetical protein